MPTLLYIGTYTKTTSEGIYVYTFDPESGALSPHSKATGIENPSFLAIDQNNERLYAVSENALVGSDLDNPDVPSGGVAAFAIDPQTRELSLLNSQPTRGGHPCHLAVDSQRRCLISANYSSGNVNVTKIADDGRFDGPADFVQHEGSGPNEKRQQSAHAHSVTLSDDERFAFICDLGIDQIMVYKVDWSTGKLSLHDEVALHPGAGPRHFAFHPTNSFAYVINELDSTVTVFDYDASQGKLTARQTISTLPDDFEGGTTADVHVSPDGRFLYGSNRGHDSIAIFAIDEETGELEARGHESTRGRTPRNFALSPSGDFLLAANQDTDNVVVYRVDKETGTLSATGEEISVPMPVCLKFVEA